jgi:rod shape-determining protein MreD
MKDYLIFLPLTILYLVIKGTLFPTVPLPDLPLVIVLYVAYNKPSIEGALLAFIIGWIEDALTAGVFGTTSAALVVVFLALHLISKRMHFTTPVMKAAAAGILSLIKGGVIYAVLSFTDFDVPFLNYIIFQAIITAAFAPAIIVLISRLTGYLNPHSFKR